MSDPDDQITGLPLLPFPWFFMTRGYARRLIAHIEDCHRIINGQQVTIMRLQSRLNETSCHGSGQGEPI